jgi:hypothetical protein
MKKHCKRTPIHTCAPMLVLVSVRRDIALAERLSVQAFVDGTATTTEFDNLADSRDMLAFAVEQHSDETVEVAAELGLHALLAIMERHVKTGKLGVSGEELKALKVMADVSEEFWKRQSGALFARCYKALRRARLEQHKGRKAA